MLIYFNLILFVITFNLTFYFIILSLNKTIINQPKMKVARRYDQGVELHQAYIDILLRLAGYRLSDLYTSILAHSSYYGTINKDIKKSIADKNETSTQVISNAITKLRKLGVLDRNVVNKKLVPNGKTVATLTLELTTKVTDLVSSEPKPSRVAKLVKSNKMKDAVS
jgi:hypothetical protein